MNTRFTQSVEDHNLMKVRLALSNELLLDPRGLSFVEMLDYASNRLPDLFEEDKGGNFIYDESAWDEEYMSNLHIRLNNNFSHEKLAHFQDVVKVVLKEKIDALNTEVNAPKTTLNVNARPSNKNRKELAIIAGGAISAVIGLCVGSPALKATLISVGIAGIAYGGYNIYKK